MDCFLEIYVQRWARIGSFVRILCVEDWETLTEIGELNNGNVMVIIFAEEPDIVHSVVRYRRITAKIDAHRARKIVGKGPANHAKQR